MFAKKTNGRVWELLENADRSSQEAEEMVQAAHTSLYHWLHAGTSVHHQRGMWMIARVQTMLGNSDEALRYALRCLELTEEYADEMQDFDIAFAYEGAGRVYALVGDKQEAEKYIKLAEEAGGKIEDDQDRKIFEADFQGGHFFVVR
ncbi:MAG: hypothetical protein GTO14_07000 [Anaerolineales bacterium]|nr:hypothetical protein [Anaerolineales bacterium]